MKKIGTIIILSLLLLTGCGKSENKLDIDDTLFETIDTSVKYNYDRYQSPKDDRPNDYQELVEKIDERVNNYDFDLIEERTFASRANDIYYRIRTLEIMRVGYEQLGTSSAEEIEDIQEAIDKQFEEMHEIYGIRYK